MKPKNIQYLLPFLLGIGYLVVIILKITNTIDWSWDWVLSPLWVIGGMLCIMLFLMGAFLSGILLVGEVTEESEEIIEEKPVVRWSKRKGRY